MGRQRTFRRLLLLLPGAITIQLLYTALSLMHLPLDRDLGEVPIASSYAFHYTNSTTVQLDMMVPVFERDDRLRRFGMRLRKAIKSYRKVYRLQRRQRQGSFHDYSVPEISIFRILVTRFTPQEHFTSESLQLELANITGIPENQIVMVHAPDGQTFSRARALNMLHSAACQHPGCMATRLDVDMEVRQEFFTHAVETVLLRRQPSTKNDYDDGSGTETGTTVIQPDNLLYANDNTPVVYFPIVWSTYKKESLKLVHELFQEREQDPQFQLPEFNEHRGHWREYGTGMYVMQGSDAHELSFNTSFEGWGGEDNEFYQRVKAVRRIMRRNETGLIHRWHPKQCNNGTDILNERQARNCRRSVELQNGSKLGRELLQNATRLERELQRNATRLERERNATINDTGQKSRQERQKIEPESKAAMRARVLSKVPKIRSHRQFVEASEQWSLFTNKRQTKSLARA